MSGVDAVVDSVVTAIELLGAGIMVAGGAVVLLRHAVALARDRAGEAGYRRLRSELGRVLLVGLEILIVADVIQTIVVEPTVESVGVLGAIVVIRTVLGLSIDVEVDGAPPWRRGRAGSP